MDKTALCAVKTFDCSYTHCNNMKNNILFLGLIFATAGRAQDIAPPLAVGKIMYNRTTTLPGDRHYNGTTTLWFHPERSLFVHNDAPAKSQSVYYEDIESSGTVAGDSTGFPILKLHWLKKIWFKESFPFVEYSGMTILSDTFATTVWAIDPAQARTIGGFTCEKAVGHYRGRDYEVWYAPDIPIPSGPFKLGGLPGLIMEARSTDGKVQFLFAGMEFPLKTSFKIEMPPGGRYDKRNYDQMRQFIRDFIQKLQKQVEAQGVEMTIGAPMESIELNANN